MYTDLVYLFCLRILYIVLLICVMQGCERTLELRTIQLGSNKFSLFQIFVYLHLINSKKIMRTDCVTYCKSVWYKKKTDADY